MVRVTVATQIESERRGDSGTPRNGAGAESDGNVSATRRCNVSHCDGWEMGSSLFMFLLPLLAHTRRCSACSYFCPSLMPELFSLVTQADISFTQSIYAEIDNVTGNICAGVIEHSTRVYRGN